MAMEQFRPRPVYIADSFMLPVGKYNGHHRQRLSFFELVESVHGLLDSSAIPRGKIDCVVVGSQNPFAFSQVDNVAAKAAGVLGISGAKSLLVDTASSSGASAFEAAYMEIASGRHENVLAIGVQKMSDVSTGDATRIVAGVIDRDEAEYGLTMPACGALVAKSLMAEFGLGEREWTDFSARLTERAQRFAARNPDAHLCEEIPVAKYLADIETGRNYLYVSPLRYHDFCPMSDGVAACLLSSSRQGVQVAGLGSGTDIPTLADRRTLTTFPATVIALRYALGMAGLASIEELEGKIHINMHDPFNGFGPINLADLGVVPRERMLEALFDDALTGPGGRFATNITGGLKGRGHPLGATGMIQIVENHRMIEEGLYKAGLSHSIGGPINNNVVILLEETSHLESRGAAPYKPLGLPRLSSPKPTGLDLESLFAQSRRITGRFIVSTTKHHLKTGEVLRALVVFATQVDGTERRFLIGLEPAAGEALSHLKPRDRMVLEKRDDQITLNEIPIRRFYRKTLEGIVDLADTTLKKLRRNREQ